MRLRVRPVSATVTSVDKVLKCLSAFEVSGVIFQRKIKAKPAAIDLAAIRDTLLYIESDLVSAPEYASLLKPVREALVQIEALEAPSAVIEQWPQNVVRFLPAKLA